MRPPSGSPPITPKFSELKTQDKPKTKKKAARFPERPFLSHGSLTFKRAISGRRIRGPISRFIPIGSRCLSGQSRSVARSVRAGFPSP